MAKHYQSNPGTIFYYLLFKYSSTENQLTRSIKLAVPVSIIKFITYSKIENRKFFERQWSDSERKYFCTQAKPLNRKLFTSCKDIFDLPQYFKLDIIRHDRKDIYSDKYEYACSFDLMAKENFLMKIEEIHGIVTFKIRVQAHHSFCATKIIKNLMFLFCWIFKCFYVNFFILTLIFNINTYFLLCSKPN